ncbi:exodeoxyribonuclease VII small subunit [Cellulosimicrobium cellulans]|uniref:Exodeoxyribonuclease 7 small subunit n=1 Tax=Cellulosimicrobium cellulans TaxID=1710 RepID=A0A4Y4DUK9_CELCE|nr:exodeoxyribonuclease VII small subunit [Cellulosimicrobium cellulans]UKJ64229.1 exodeoxyribonuclease VII small subunit [Cellulosimicrobium cellulans]GED09062.1 hypothetical protein CCE02nite_10610 [Cellulosimicrobium cellulans]
MGLNTAVTSFDNAVTPDVATLSYEQARDELVQVVARLEAGGEPLEASLALWERGEALAARCQEWLDGARARLDAARAPEAHDEPDETPDDTTGDDR